MANGSAIRTPPEKVLVDLLLQKIVSIFGEVLASGVDVPSHGQARTDLVLVVSNELVAIEVKTLNWKKAIAQAYLNRYCVDRSYIALWEKTVRPQVIREAKNRGLGLLSIGEENVTIVRQAPRSRPRRWLRSPILAAIGEVQ